LNTIHLRKDLLAFVLQPFGSGKNMIIPNIVETALILNYKSTDN
jgi:hypothetical protein